MSKHLLLFIGTEKAKIDAELDKIPLDRTVIIGGARHRKPQPLAGRTPPEPAIQQPTGSGFLRRLLFAFLPVAVIVGIGLWGLRDEPSFFRGMISKDKSTDHRDLRQFPVVKQEPIPPDPEPRVNEEVAGASDLEPAFAIDAIVWSSEGASSFALINGMKVMAGQPIDGMTVKEIGRDYVVLGSEDSQATVRLTLTLK